MLTRAKFYSSAVFFVERWSFSLQDPFFFLYFLDFQRLVRVRSASMTNTRTFQEVTHPSTTLVQARLTAEF